MDQHVSPLIPNLDALAKVFHYVSLDVLLFLVARTKLMCPRSAGVQLVPSGHHALTPSRAWIVVAEAVNNRVPHWSEATNEQTLPQWNPDRLNDQPPRVEVCDVEIGCRLHAVNVLAETVAESTCGGCHDYPLACSCGYRLA